MGPRQLEAGIVVAVFVASAIWGGAFYARYVRTGHHPFFYQSYFEPAVMTACGRGFLISRLQPPALRAFLLEQTDTFSCDDLPRDLQVGTEGLYQRPWRYLMTTVAIAWRVFGISWSGLAPLFGVLYGATTALAYALCRLIVGRITAIACAAALCLSRLQLANLPNLRDYAKAPFTLALALILIALVVRKWRRRDLLLLSLCYGLVIGIGYGFRTDLLIDIPPFLVTIALFLPGGVLRNVPLKLAAIVLLASGFVVAGWPIITTVVAGGGCQWHAFLLGLTTPFNDALGVTGGAYGWGHLYKDEYLWATVSSYASRFRPDLGYIEYCSHEYDVASWDYLRHILMTFPADMLTRAYASVLRLLALPFPRWIAFTYAGAVLGGAAVLAISWSSMRLALFATFVILYFAGHPFIQFLPRHYFPFELIGWALLALLVEGGVPLAMDLVRGGRWPLRSASVANVHRVLACAIIVAAGLAAPLGLLRWYQSGRVTRLLESYEAASAPLRALAPVAPGQLRLPADPGARPRPSVEVIADLGRAKVRFIEAELDSAACRPGTTVTFRYDPAYPDTDFSRTVPLALVEGVRGATRLFEPVYSEFVGLDVSDPSPGCLLRVAALDDLDRFPLLVSAQLTPGWDAQPQYQHIDRAR